MRKLIYVFFVSVIFVSCGKYPDGGRYGGVTSNRQPLKVCGEWAIEKRFINEIETPFSSEINKYRLLFEKDGSYQESYLKNGAEIIVEGTWSRSRFEKYTISTEKGTIDFTVTRLKRNQMWFNYLGLDGKVYEYHLINARKADD